MNPQLIKLLKNGKIGVIPTDTIYGMVGSALNPEAVEKIYFLRKRDKDKPFIILIYSLGDLKRFGIKLTKKQEEFLKKIWPNPISVVLPCPGERFSYLHRGTKSLAFRVPKNEKLLEILQKVGPLVAPSANHEGKKPAQIIDEAKKYFGEKIEFYVDAGTIKSEPSTIIQLNNHGLWKTLRQGSYKLV